MQYDMRFLYRLEVTPADSKVVTDVIYCKRLTEAAYHAGVAAIAYPGAKMEVVNQRSMKPGKVVRWAVRQVGADRFLDPIARRDPTGGTLPLFAETPTPERDPLYAPLKVTEEQLLNEQQGVSLRGAKDDQLTLADALNGA